MGDEQLLEIQQALFFELGHKIDIYHFEKFREIAVVKHGDFLTKENLIKVYNY